jgi:hypothetical protein
MAVGGTGHPRRSWLDALFGEAWEREHTRRRRHMLVALLVAAAAAALALGLRDGGRVPSGASAGSAVSVKVSSAVLPSRGSYHQLAAVDGRLVVTGGDVDSATGACSSTTVDAASLRVISAARGNCANPALYGQHVLPVNYISSHSGPSGLTLGLRIATAVRGAPAGYTLGPTVLTYSQCSDCNIAWIYGDGSLWVYSPFATSMARNVGELFRISEHSGRVVQRWKMPSFTRALLAVDRDGLWVSQSLYGGMPLHVPATQRLDYRSLYRIAAGMRSPVRVKALSTWGAYWIVAAGHSVWVDQSDGRKPSRLWRLVGAGAAAALSARPVPSGADCGEMGEGQPSTAGDAQVGIYCIALSETGGKLQGFGSDTGSAHSTAVPALRQGAASAYDSGPGPAVVLGHSVFFLEKARLLKATTS